MRTHQTPLPSLGFYLRATATYDDDDGNVRTAQAVSASRVRAKPTSTDEDPC